MTASQSTVSTPERRLLPAFCLLVILVAGLLLRLRIVLGSESVLLSALPDDAFYYLQIARNVVSGLGVTFDGRHVTNGFHPLWLLSLLPPARLVSDPIALVRVAAGIGLGLNLVAVTLAYDWLRLSTATIPALAAVTLLYLNPAAAANSVNGLETSLAALIGVLAIRAIWFRRSTVSVGFLLGALVLARSDLVLVAFPLGIAHLIHQGPARGRSLLLRLLLPAAAVLAPWYLWSWTAVGSPWPSSASAVPALTHANYLHEHTTGELMLFSLGLLRQFLLGGIARATGLPWPFWLLLGTAVAVSLLRPGGRRFVAWRWLLLALTIGCGFLVLIHVPVRWLARAWYFDLLIWQAALWLAWLFWRLGRLQRPVLVWGALLLIALSLSGWRDSNRWLLAYPHQVEFRAAAGWLNENLATEEFAGAFNAGIVGYFTGGQVVNLDGVVNHEAYVASMERNLLRFMAEVPVRYLADYGPTIATHRLAFGSSELLRAEEVARIDIAGVSWEEAPGEPLRIFELDWEPRPDSQAENR